MLPLFTSRSSEEPMNSLEKCKHFRYATLGREETIPDLHYQRIVNIVAPHVHSLLAAAKHNSCTMSTILTTFRPTHAQDGYNMHLASTTVLYVLHKV